MHTYGFCIYIVYMDFTLFSLSKHFGKMVRLEYIFVDL